MKSLKMSQKNPNFQLLLQYRQPLDSHSSQQVLWGAPGTVPECRGPPSQDCSPKCSDSVPPRHNEVSTLQLKGKDKNGNKPWQNKLKRSLIKRDISKSNFLPKIKICKKKNKNDLKTKEPLKSFFQIHNLELLGAHGTYIAHEEFAQNLFLSSVWSGNQRSILCPHLYSPFPWDMTGIQNTVNRVPWVCTLIALWKPCPSSYLL